MNTTPVAGAADFALVAPEIFLLCAACAILLIDLWLPQRLRQVTYLLSLVALVVSAVLVAGLPGERMTAFGGTWISDPVAKLLKLVTCGTVAAVFLYSRDYLLARGLFRGEYFVLGLFATLGIFVMVSSGSLLTMYMGIELLALSQYALVAFDRDSPVAAESAMKYFVLGAIASGALLYGISIIYGVTGTFDLDELAAGLDGSAATNVGLLFGLAFLMAGIAFKFGAVPFHMWVPDVYHGAPTSVTLFLGAAPKLAYFALALRVLAEGLGSAVQAWQDMLIVLAVLSLVVGNLVAVAQTNLKRMLAYSTISNVGFILLGILAGTPDGYRAALFYVVTYVIMAVGSFAMIVALSRRGFEADRIDDFRGLAQKSPWFAWMMLFLMVSTAGVPPFVGFFAKLYVLQAIVDVGFVWLAGVAVLFSVVGAFYYLRIVKVMFFDEPAPGLAVSASGSFRFLLSVNALAVLALGLFSGALLDAINRALP
ncbi:MAG: NADH-quinone oxidoreductase subunit NuoN [Steroidobacteraceae bacterium]|jgi:NADH-quinone oxidoreductase subunit N|nr:NADH-quinone oxidoreductase subunit NuoN [Steroidobacteraceae bacterium]